MRYQINPDTVCTGICGKYLLIAARNQWDRLPYVQEINSQAYFCWKLLEETGDSRKMEALAAQEYGISPEEAGKAVKDFLGQLEKKGYIMAEVSRRPEGPGRDTLDGFR